ncbi:hypothetical protein IAQ00_09855 [Pantoea ananatis]|uniref:hypothetical protein n=1 Tax=Pantoea ananas TaxID=553 RepID=UPI00207934E8|nr:hypothetical protein [Pantoea ananatis]MCW0353987.1 hypothetical protein [Pantoea ananatis]USL60008.1 hypothetical protein IAQ00_09855 [Pantoea ananatis]
MEWTDLISKVLVGVASGLAVAFYTARYTLNKFYTEKWWEKKYENYSQLLTTLYSLKLIYEDSLNDAWAIEHYYIIGQESGEDEPKARADWTNHENFMNELKKSLVMSPLLLSNTTQPKIEKFFNAKKEVDKEVSQKNYPDYLAYDDTLSSINELIEEIIIEAQSELMPRKLLKFNKNELEAYLTLIIGKGR